MILAECVAGSRSCEGDARSGCARHEVSVHGSVSTSTLKELTDEVSFRLLYPFVSEDAIQGRLFAVIFSRPRRLYVGSPGQMPPSPEQISLRVLYTSRTITGNDCHISRYVIRYGGRTIVSPTIASRADPTPELPLAVLHNTQHVVRIQRGQVVVARIIVSP